MNGDKLMGFKISDPNQIEILISTTQAFTEQLIIQNKLLEQIRDTTLSQSTYFISQDGFAKTMNTALLPIKDKIKDETNLLYYKLAGTLVIIASILEAISKIFSN